MRGVASAVAMLLLVSGCSVGNDVPAGEAAIARFHAQLNAGAFADIYAAASPDMKAASTSAKLTQLLAAVHRKLGLFKGGKTQGWNDTFTGNGHLLNLSYAANYERGAAIETFVLRIDGAQAALAGYNINSDALILN